MSHLYMAGHVNLSEWSEHMNRHLCLAAIVVLLGGCATPGELRQRTPAMELRSAHDSKLVAACIADKWENAIPALGTQPVKMRVTSNGYSVAHGNEETIHLADVKDAPGGGSFITYYKNRSSLLEPFDAGVSSCQK